MRRILKTGRNCQEIAVADSTGLLIDGKDYYRAFYHAAERARRHIVVSGWVFDSGVRLLRGRDAMKSNGRIRFLDFLDDLCSRNPELKVYILAWDFSVVFALEREWMQDLIFSSTRSKQIFFHFDANHPFGACQHQKFAVIDGQAAFVGGMDIAAGRWDDRRHIAENPDRTRPDGSPYEPYHDVQSYHTGPVAESLKDLFEDLWKDATGAPIALTPAPPATDYLPEGTGIPLAARSVAIARTRARSVMNMKRPVREIRSLYIDAIRSAESLIYIENQYFSSYAVYRALIRRMKARKRPKLNIVMILPLRTPTLIERVSVGLAQAKLLRTLKKVAKRRGHSLGIYYPAGLRPNGGGKDVPVFVHSKLMIVDDRFITVGSANTNNRSMGFDTELNVAWEADGKDGGLAETITRARVDLLAEHVGMNGRADRVMLARAGGLVDYLNTMADRPFTRLKKRRMDPLSKLSGWLKWLRLDRILIDPERAVIDEYLDMLAPAKGSIFSRVKRWVARKLFP